jgi:hypothetical protein
VAAEDAEAFCAWLSEVDGRRYALPSSEQWEYAGRAGTTTLWWTGDDQEELLRREVFEGRSSLKVGSRSPNPFGYYDMLGNVSEWCRDSTNYSRRGGHAGAPARSSHSAFRWNAREPQAHGGTGFRVAVVGDLKASAPVRDPGPIQGPGDNPATIKLQSFPHTRTTTTRIGVRQESDGYRVENEEPRPVHLFSQNIQKLPRVTVNGGVIWLRAQVRCEGLLGQASLKLAARWSDGSVLVTEDGEQVTGTSDWVWRQTRLPLKAGQRPDYADLELFINGKGTVWIKDVELLYDPPGKNPVPAQPPAERVRVFNTRDVPLTPDAPGDIRWGWRIEAKNDRTAPLFEVTGPPKGPGYLVWRAKMKTEGVTGEAYFEAIGQTADSRVDTAKSYTSAMGTSDWRYYEVAVPMHGNQLPSLTTLAVVVKGKGTVWVKEIELLKLPPVTKGRAKDVPARSADDGSKEVGPPPRLIEDPPTKKK